MILQQLYALAHRAKLVESPAFEELTVPLLIVIDLEGEFRGIFDNRGEIVTPPKKPGGKESRKPGRGKPESVPRAHGNTASQGFARYFADTLPRVLPMELPTEDSAKAARSRETFWKQIDRAASECTDDGLQALAVFGKSLAESEEVRAQVTAEIARNAGLATERCAFKIVDDGGPLLLARRAIRDWYAGFYASVVGSKQADGPTGVCQITGLTGPVPVSHPVKFQGVPGGMSVGVSVVSNDKPAFQSYGLDASANSAVGYDGVEGYSQALKALIEKKLPKDVPTKIRVNEMLFVFWTRDEADLGFMSLFDSAKPSDSDEEENEAMPARIERLFAGLDEGKKDAAKAVEPNEFYLLGLSGNAARVIVRSYLTARLSELRSRVEKWFADLRIVAATKDGQGKPTDRFAMWQLAVATAMESDRVAPDTPTRLMLAALEGTPVPESLLLACLQRLRVEGSEGFRQPARMALIKLILLRGGVAVKVELDADEVHPAYLCGRLLSLLEQIQFAALGDVNAGVVDKFYGTFSAAPAMVFPRLVANAQNHLRKLQSDKPGLAFNLEKHLSELLVSIPAGGPPGRLSLRDQGRFAIGFYHEKAKRMADSAKAKVDRAMKAASDESKQV